MVACHEIGHHLGGAPKIFRGKSSLRSWSSAEGQADYFAATKCLTRIFSDGLDIKSHENDIDNINLKYALSKCDNDICVRIVMAGLNLSRVFASLKIDSKVPEIFKNDPTIALETIYNHPNPQCRFDTYLSGAICDVSIDIPFENIDPRPGACQDGARGSRPLCWFREGDF